MESSDEGPKPSYGNIGDHHWSRARTDLNQEALQYYRERSRAPGVAAGGTERNFYCMRCDGVIPFEPAVASCPHCGEPVDERIRRYFNWVEINDPVESDARALAKLALVLAGALLALALISWWILT